MFGQVSNIKFNASNCPGVYKWNACIPEISCLYFMKIPREHQCEFVRTVSDCTQDDAYIQFMEIFACEFNCYEGQIYYGVGTVLAEIIVLFILLSATADFFFGPSLCTLSNIMGLSDHIAGVTILAFGNAAPDILTSVIGASRLGPELVLCQLLGGGMFVTTVVAGVIVLTKQFRADVESFMRDTSFYLLAISFLFHSAEDDTVELWEAVLLILMYFVYIGLVIWQMIRIKLAERKREKAVISSSDVTEDLSGSRANIVRNRDGDIREMKPSPMNLTENPFLNRGSIRVSILERPGASGTTLEQSDMSVPRRRGSTRSSYMRGILSAQRINALRNAGLQDQVYYERMGHATSTAVMQGKDTIYEKKTSLIWDFINEMNPVDEDDWDNTHPCAKLLLLLQAPVVYLLKLVIPVVDQSALNNGWCKLLNSIHCVTAPLFSAYAAQVLELPLVACVSVLATLFILGISAATVVLVTASVDRPPRYHIVFAVVGFIVSMLMIYTLAHELVYVIGVLGYILDLDLPVLAMTLLAWGNSVGDLVANIGLSQAGYPRMAWAGSFGSPLMSVLLGAGLSFTILVEMKGGDHKLHFEPHHQGIIFDCFFFLFLSLLSSLIIMPTQNFQCRRSFGFYLLMLYLMYMIFNILTVTDVIHTLREP